MNLPFLFDFTLLLGQSHPESVLACKSIGITELILIIGLLAGLIIVVVTTVPSAITVGSGGLAAKIALPGVITKIIASLGIGASMTQIVIPLKAFLEIAAVKGAIDVVKSILECHSPSI